MAIPEEYVFIELVASSISINLPIEPEFFRRLNNRKGCKTIIP